MRARARRIFTFLFDDHAQPTMLALLGVVLGVAVAFPTDRPWGRGIVSYMLGAFAAMSVLVARTMRFKKREAEFERINDGLSSTIDRLTLELYDARAEEGDPTVFSLTVKATPAGRKVNVHGNELELSREEAVVILRKAADGLVEWGARREPPDLV